MGLSEGSAPSWKRCHHYWLSFPGSPRASCAAEIKELLALRSEAVEMETQQLSECSWEMIISYTPNN